MYARVDENTLWTMQELLRQPPKPHDEMKLGKPKKKKKPAWPLKSFAKTPLTWSYRVTAEENSKRLYLGVKPSHVVSNDLKS